MAYQGPTVSVHVKITINPSHTEAFLEAFKATMEAVTAEPLNTFFELYRDEKNPGVFRLVENWNATPDYMMQVQVKKDYYKPYHKAMESMLVEPLEVEILSRMPGSEWNYIKPEFYAVRK